MKYLVAIFLIFSTPVLADQWLSNCLYKNMDDEAGKHTCFAKNGGGLSSCMLIQNITNRYICAAEITNNVSYCDKIPEENGAKNCYEKMHNDKYIITP